MLEEAALYLTKVDHVVEHASLDHFLFSLSIV